ncbi:MAG: type II toxin-antitoxin system PemK/MazF family toxin [Leptolyngbya sp. SIO4C5]|nr:type II toxin-antitoxin system PemK/MazF family toxin [Leptolyngbya sp. SIO4C5]
MENPSSSKGKVVLVPFPFDNLSTTKVRPAVCLTDPIGTYKHVLLAFVTSRIAQEILPTDIILDKSHPDFAVSGLHKPSTLRLHFLMTARVSLILRELGYLSNETQADIAKQLCNFIKE